MIVCVHSPRLELVMAGGDRSRILRQTLAGSPLAVAPAPGAASSPQGQQRIGEVSGAAEAHGVVRGMALGEALARCPRLALLPADPVRVAEAWEAALEALESIGAAVEPAGPGLAYFEADALRGVHGTRAAAVIAARRAVASCDGAGLGTRLPVRVGGGPTRFCALAAALEARSSRPLVWEGREARRWLSGRPLGLLAFRRETAPLVAPLARLGVRTLGELERLGRAALADRFGAAGVLAHRLACGEDAPLRARRLEERLQEEMEVGDASCGEALGRVLGVLVNRLLARSERRGRTLRAVTLSARLLTGGGWREHVVFRQPRADPERIWLALSLRLPSLPAPAGALALAVDRYGPPASEQGELFAQELAGGRSEARRARPARSGGRPRSWPGAPSPARAARLRDALAQVRAVAGPDAALRAVCVDPDSRVPERRVVLAPIPD
ncbi:MAG TPA: hypothetical protein VL979_08660 [Solirubrobacteraceae bacterium]|nr:hypothetical protein [Solirubrobacteraceae bacterium]